MTNQELKNFSDMILIACLEAINSGWNIAREVYAHRTHKTCCALVAVGFQVSEDIWDNYEDSIVDLAKITLLVEQKTGHRLSAQERVEFIKGFDSETGNTPYALAGRRVCALLLSEGLMAPKQEHEGNE